MKRWLGPLAVLLVCAAATHAVTLAQAPAFIMARAMATLADRGVALHAFTATPRVTPQSQQVVRSSPDLSYALCRYDLGEPGQAEALMADMAKLATIWNRRPAGVPNQSRAALARARMAATRRGSDMQTC
jgi:hypothetical protein